MKKELYKVTDIQNDIIIVTPLDSINIETENDGTKEKFSPHIEVLNPKKLNIKPGSVVHIALSRQIESVAGVILLFVPVLLAFGVYFVSEPFSKLIHTKFSETIKFIFALISFITSSIIEFFVTRNIKTILTPVIVRVEKN